MPKSVNRTRDSNIKCSNCKFVTKSMQGPIEVLVCKRNNAIVDYWDKCDDFQWTENKEYNDTPQVNLYR